LTLCPLQGFKVFSHVLGLLSPAFLSAQLVAGSPGLNGNMDCLKKACMWMGMNVEDVVKYRQAFIERWKQYEKRFHLWDNDGNPLPLPKGFPVPGAIGRFRSSLSPHDESIFFQNDCKSLAGLTRVISQLHLQKVMVISYGLRISHFRLGSPL